MKKGGKWGKIFFCILTYLAGIITGVRLMVKLCENALTEQKDRGDRNGKNFRVSCKWISALLDNKRMQDYLESHNIKEVAIYGIGELGNCLVKELEFHNITIKYLIDKKKNKEYKYPIFQPEDNLPDVEAIIVTPVYDFETIESMLSEKTTAKILSIEEIINEL